MSKAIKLFFLVTTILLSNCNLEIDDAFSSKNFDSITKQPSVVLLINQGGLCGCNISEIAMKLNDVYSDDKSFFTVILEEETEALAEKIIRERDILPGVVYFDPDKYFERHFVFGNKASLIFLEKGGQQIGALPAELKGKDALKIAHQIINKY